MKCEQGKMCQLDADRQPICTCEDNCDSQGFAPVCGRDGRTYSNKCTLEKEACRKRKNIEIHFQGACDGMDDRTQIFIQSKVFKNSLFLTSKLFMFYRSLIAMIMLED